MNLLFDRYLGLFLMLVLFILLMLKIFWHFKYYYIETGDSNRPFFIFVLNLNVLKKVLAVFPLPVLIHKKNEQRNLLKVRRKINAIVIMFYLCIVFIVFLLNS